ncbi:hypothetical protein ACIQOV_05705 [Kitasatospora sp. NPDC091257]|uniref:hypothetical protein n=1 Tax=Kitasatospora sp. NPDC091257 TaxID=3364084 RepID=UPI0038156F0D
MIHRDLVADPLPHPDVHGTGAGSAPAEARGAERAAAFAPRGQVMAEPERAARRAGGPAARSGV